MDAVVTKRETLFAVEKFADAYHDALALTALHWNEIAPYRDLLFLNPDLELYEKLDKAGALVTCTARHHGDLIGYYVLMMSKHPHYKHVLVATEDLHFVLKEHRGWTGIKLMKFAESVAKDRGARLIVSRAKAASGHGALYHRLGYDLMDEVYTKRLDRGS